MHNELKVVGWYTCTVVALTVLVLSAGRVQGQTAWTKVNNALPPNSNTTSTDGRIPRGTSGGDSAHALCPSVLKVGNEYWMWYSGHDGTKWRIYHATSPDGLNWTKVNNSVSGLDGHDTGGSRTDGRLGAGSTGSGDVSGIYRPQVIFDGAQFWMWYQGQAADNLIRLYCATSANGRVWTKVNNAIPDPSNTNATGGRIPLGGAGRGDASNIGRAAVIRDGNTFKMWYGGNASGTWRGYHATSGDGLTWTKYTNVIESASNAGGTHGRIPLGGSGRGDVSHVYILGVIKDDTVYRMWYTGNDGTWNSIYYATSTNGLNWTKVNNVKLSAGDTGPRTDGRIPKGATGGDANYLLSGSVMRDGPTYKIWYTGYDGSSVARTYMATAPANHPTISNAYADVLGGSMVDLVGHLVATGSAAATVRVYYGTADEAFDRSQWQASVTLGQGAAGLWTNRLTTLDPLTTYYFRFYATNSMGDDWADAAGSFTTLAAGSMVQARPASGIGMTHATMNGRVLNTGGEADLRVFICMDFSDKGTVSTGSWSRVINLGIFHAIGEYVATNQSDLVSGSNYAYRLYATNSTATSWSAEAATFQTLYRPVVTNPGADTVSAGTARLRGVVLDSGNDTPAVWFDYWGTGGGVTTTVSMGSQTGAFSMVVTGLEPVSPYAYRIRAANVAGTGYSTTNSFNTLGGLYVALSGDNSAGTNWASAYTNLQTAVTGAGTGAVIFVKADTFGRTAQIDLSGKVNLRIRGGYTGTAPEPGPLAAGLSVFSRSSGYTRLFYGNAATVTIERLRIQGGYLNAAGSEGGALYFTGGSEVTLRDCVITNNQCYASSYIEGGALYQDSGRLTVANCVFAKNALNKASWDNRSRGGAAYVINAVSSWSNVVFSGNTVWTRHYDNHGGAVFLSGGQARFVGCLFTNNYSSSEGNADAGPTRGGALHADGVAPLMLDRVTFTRNRLAVTSGGGARQGGALYLGGASGNAVLVECVFTGNGDGAEEAGDIAITAGTLSMTNVLVVKSAGGSGLYLNGGTVQAVHCTFANNVLDGANRLAGTLTVLNSIAWGNGSSGFNNANTVEYSCSQNITAGTGNLNVDPEFSDTVHFHIKARAGAYTNGYFSGGSWVQHAVDSPCLDTGHPDSPYAREPHPNGFRVEMGAYGNSTTASKTYLEAPGVFTALTAFAHPALPVDQTTARLRGQVLSDGGGDTPRAVLCWGTVDGGTTGTNAWQNALDMGLQAEWNLFTHDLADLAGTWYYRAYVTNSTGEDWSSAVLFSAPGPATLTNLGPYRIQRSAAWLRGQVVTDGGNTPSLWFWHWQEGSAVTSVTAVGQVPAPLTFSTEQTGLNPSTTYNYRILSSNNIGISWSETRTYTTLSTAPIARYVTVPGAGTYDGTSWTNAFIGIANAIEECRYPGDVIYVKQGTYERGTPIDLGGLPGVTIAGGYDGTGTPGARSGAHTVFTRDTDYLVRVVQGVAATATLDRVMIRGGYLTASSSKGAGLHFSGGSRVELRDCIFTNNIINAPGNNCEGGVVYFDGGSLTASNCLFVANSVRKANYDTGAYGGSVYARNAAVGLMNCQFRQNYVWTRHQNVYGGAVYLTGGSLDVRDCIFTNNYTQQEGNSDGPGPARGGAIHASALTAFSITNTTFRNNRCYTPNASFSLREGGVVYVSGVSGSKTMSRCVLTGNGDGADENGDIFLANGTMSVANVLVARSAGGSGVYNSAGTLEVNNCTLVSNVLYGVNNLSGTLTVRNSIAWANGLGGINNAGAITYTCAQQVHAGAGNFSADPLFADTVYYHLQSPAGYYAGGYFSGGDWAYALEKSPCVDAGDASSPFLLEPAPNGGRVNLGAYGNTAVASRSLAGGSIFLFR